MNLDSAALQAEWDKVMVLWNKTIDAKNGSYGVADKNAEENKFYNDYFNQPTGIITGSDKC